MSEEALSPDRAARFKWDEDDLVLIEESKRKDFDPDQPRDEAGRWSETGAGGTVTTSGGEKIPGGYGALHDTLAKTVMPKMGGEEYESQRKAYEADKQKVTDDLHQKQDEARRSFDALIEMVKAGSPEASDATVSVLVDSVRNGDVKLPLDTRSVPLAAGWTDAQHDEFASLADEAVVAKAEADKAFSERLTAIDAVDAKQGVDFWHEHYTRNPDEFATEMDKMRGGWRHIGGDGPQRYRWAAALAFGLDKDEQHWVAWDADGTVTGTKGPVPFDAMERPGEITRFAGLMREQYLDTQLELDGEDFETIDEPEDGDAEPVSDQDLYEEWSDSGAYAEWQNEQQSEAIQNLSAKDKVELLSSKDEAKGYEWAVDNEDVVAKHSGVDAPTYIDAWKDLYEPTDRVSGAPLDKKADAIREQWEQGYKAEIEAAKGQINDEAAVAEVEEYGKQIEADKDKLVELASQAAAFKPIRADAIVEAHGSIKAFAESLPPGLDDAQGALNRAMELIDDKVLGSPGEAVRQLGKANDLLPVDRRVELGAIAGKLQDINERTSSLQDDYKSTWDSLNGARSEIHSLVENDLNSGRSLSNEIEERSNEMRDEWLNEYALKAYVEESDEGQEAWQQQFFEDFEYGDDSDAFANWKDSEGKGEATPTRGRKMDVVLDPKGLITMTRGIRTDWQKYVPNFVESYSVKPNVAGGFGHKTKTEKIDKRRVLTYQGSKHWRTKGGGMGNTEYEFLVLPRAPSFAKDGIEGEKRRLRKAREHEDD